MQEVIQVWTKAMYQAKACKTIILTLENRIMKNAFQSMENADNNNYKFKKQKVGKSLKSHTKQK